MGHRPLKDFKAHHLAQCRACGMVFTFWEPSEEDLGAYYADYPVVTDISQVTLLRYNELLQRFSSFRKTGCIMDVGCGGGYFLEQAIKAGWDAHGTEYGARQITTCRAKGIAITEGALNPANHPAESFDVICSFEVIEHVTHPVAEVANMLALLRPGGLLYLTTPNFNCLDRRLAKGTWNVVNYPEHLNFFTPRTMHRLLREKGLTRSWLTTSGVSIERWMTRRGRTPESSREAHHTQDQFREKVESKTYLKLAKRVVNGLLNTLELGDSMKACYVKPHHP